MIWYNHLVLQRKKLRPKGLKRLVKTLNDENGKSEIKLKSF